METNSIDLDRILSKRPFQHVLFWIVVILYFCLGYGAPGRYGETLARVLLFLPGHIFLTYMFFYMLIPRYLLPKRYLTFIGLGILTYFVSLLYGYLINFHLLPKVNLQSIWVGSPLIAQTTMLGAALSIKFLKQWYKEKQHVREIEQQKTKAELNLLKSQIHPHFLFNTLNNLYAHVLEQSPKAPDILLKLSSLLRFMIYESYSPYIPLHQELSLIHQYIDLEHLRYGNRLDVSFQIEGDLADKKIAPLLFLPLIENAFKHGVSQQLDQCWISLNVHVDNNQLDFKLINSKVSEVQITDQPFRGIGIENVKKRLELIYPNQHQLSIISEKEIFMVNLQLELDQIEASHSDSRLEVHQSPMKI